MNAHRPLLAMLLVALVSLPLAAAPRPALDARVRAATTSLNQSSAAAKELASRARGTLVFPRVIKGGVGIGGGYGRGALILAGATAAYYSVTSASIGLQLGMQEQSVVILFMTDEALAKFRASRGWQAGVDGSVVIANVGAGESVDTVTAQTPIIGFVFNNKGLMYQLTLAGAKITRLKD